MVIMKLKERIKSLSGNIKEDKIKNELEETKTINIELDHKVTMLIAENEHLKQAYKQLYDPFNSSPLKDNLKKLKEKAIVDDVVTSHPIDPEMLKLDVAPLAPKPRNNRTTHSDYIWHTQEQAAILREIVEQGKSLNPLNNSLDYAYIASVLHSKLNVNSDLKCVTCNGFLFFDNHDLCILDFINNVNAHVKSKSVKKTLKRKVWKPTGNVFTNIGYIWRPTGRTFIIVGNTCPLTRITTTAEVPLKKPIALESDTPKPVVVQIILWYLDSGCSKHMTGDCSQLTNYVNKFLITFYDSDLEVAFHQHTIFILNLEGVDLLTGSQRNNLYTLSHKDMMVSSPICLLLKALKTKSWLWNRRLSYLNFGTINHLARQGLVQGLPKLKFEKDHLCFTCAMGKSKKKSYKPQSEDTNHEKLYLLHMNLCGPMHVESVNGKKYILVVISHETSVAHSPQQNGIVERHNHTLIEAARTIVDHPTLKVIAPIAEVVAPEPAASTGSPSSITVDQDAPLHTMQEELNEFECLGVGELVPRRDKVMVITLKWIYKSKYALESVKKYDFESCDPVDTPMVEKSKLDKDKEGKAIDPSHYRGMIGTLLYLTASRPDLQFAICMCARYQAWTIEKHLHAVKRIFRYRRGTFHRGLWYPKDSSITLTAFADADHAGCQDTHSSISGSMQFVGDRLIPMYCDNKSAIALCCNNVQHSKSKHINIRYHFIKEHVENGVIELYFVNTEYQLANIFTKALGRERIEFLINKLGMRSFTPKTLKQLTDKVDE
uniref:GAG-pre-integrase domain-containing protein n=1 Tax=Tanacetum cinerariifolium TaxID=118510 RepID=A0A6L2NUE3_TANCI|nr:hypothetical protein [Tanacetum cinerariifolium]